MFMDTVTNRYFPVYSIMFNKITKEIEILHVMIKVASPSEKLILLHDQRKHTKSYWNNLTHIGH